LIFSSGIQVFNKAAANQIFAAALFIPLIFFAPPLGVLG